MRHRPTAVGVFAIVVAIALVPVVWADQSTQTTTYTMTLKVGPAEQMYMSGAPAGTTAGEIMMPMAGVAMAPCPRPTWTRGSR